MTTADRRPHSLPAPPSRTRPAGSATGWRDVWALTRRNLIHISPRADAALRRHRPAGPVHPALHLRLRLGHSDPRRGSYKDFALAGLLTLNLTTSAMGTAVGLSTDLHEGVIDRFRTLPMWRSAVLVGRSISDLLSATCVRDHRCADRPGHRLAGRRQHPLGHRRLRRGPVLQLLAVVGCGLRRPEQQGPGVGRSRSGFIVLFPLAFISNALVPTTRHARTGCRPSPIGTR